MASGVFNPNPPFPILGGEGAGDWWALRYLQNWQVREPGHAVARYVAGDGRTHTAEVFGEGFAFADSRLYGPSNGPLASGTVTEYRVSWEGVPLWTFTGLSLTASEILLHGSSPDPSRPARDHNGLELYVLRGADTLTGTNGGDGISGRDGGDELHGLAGADRLFGGAGNDTLLGGAGDDTLDGGGGDNRIEGGDGDDLSMSGAGDRDTMHGGAGTDTFIASHTLRREAEVSASASGVTLSNPHPMAPDTLIAVERIAFLDGVLHFDPAGAAGQVWRLYGAALGRGAETTGLSAWVEALDSGAMTLADAAEAFVGSAEFAGRYGQLDDAGFVARLYANVLGRAPDAAGLEAWTARLAGGASRAEVLLGFSESAEYRAATVASASRLWTVDPEALDVLRAYMTVLDRQPDAGGLASWTAARNGGLANADMLDSFIGSAEFQSRFGALPNGDFVARMYLVALDRPADAAGHAAWTSALDGGALARRDVVQGFANSDEMTQKLLPLVADGIAFA